MHQETPSSYTYEILRLFGWYQFRVLNKGFPQVSGALHPVNIIRKHHVAGADAVRLGVVHPRRCHALLEGSGCVQHPSP